MKEKPYGENRGDGMRRNPFLQDGRETAIGQPEDYFCIKFCDQCAHFTLSATDESRGLCDSKHKTYWDYYCRHYEDRPGL